jgi:hypothetical protein
LRLLSSAATARADMPALIRDRRGLERSRVCSAPRRCACDALRPGHEITCAAPGTRDRMPCAGHIFIAYKTHFYLTTIRSDVRTIPSLAH